MTYARVSDEKNAQSAEETEEGTVPFPRLGLIAFTVLPAMLLVRKLCRAVALTVRELAPIAELRVLLIALIVNNSLLYYIKRVIAK